MGCSDQCRACPSLHARFQIDSGADQNVTCFERVHPTTLCRNLRSKKKCDLLRANELINDPLLGLVTTWCHQNRGSLSQPTAPSTFCHDKVPRLVIRAYTWTCVLGKSEAMKL